MNTKRELDGRSGRSEPVDLTPNWQSLMPILIVAIENGTSQGQANARRSLLTLAGKVDAAHVLHRRMCAALDTLVKVWPKAFGVTETEASALAEARELLALTAADGGAGQPVTGAGARAASTDVATRGTMADSGVRWLQTLPVLTTAHLSRTTQQLLESEGDRNPWCYCGLYEFGFFLSVPADNTLSELSERTAPQDLLALWQWARGERYEWVRLDADGVACASLPTYEE
ncbi:hypothetical protein KEX41_28165 (plasmid) [Burkholderia thailandensis]|uniref:DUF5983 family protein n=1 Tax=Burkholderia thailandensis TaxID=57975 RepID=UPI00192DEE7B|nr:hypothetical protein [Burkholderia thailandensis]MBS2132065.1 hypothetical protein [Burkholderia thailandensis]QRA15179.1 hypothetical protein JMY07_30200 [Burkholderia thailandensis]